jgi:hypothetical protein
MPARRKKKMCKEDIIKLIHEVVGEGEVVFIDAEGVAS